MFVEFVGVIISYIFYAWYNTPETQLKRAVRDYYVPPPTIEDSRHLGIGSSNTVKFRDDINPVVMQDIGQFGIPRHFRYDNQGALNICYDVGLEKF